MLRSRDMLIIARRSAGLSQGQLAAALGVARETVARWEAGLHDPSFEMLQRAAAACGLQLGARLRCADESLQALVADQLALEPLERLRELLDGKPGERCVAALLAISGLVSEVILCGAVGAALLGAPNRPGDGRIDVTVAEEDSARLLGELLELGALPGVREQRWGERHARQPWRLADGGELAVLTAPAGTRGARDLRRDALAVALADGARVLAAHPRDLLRIAYASPDERDQAMAPGYEALLEGRGSLPAAARI